MTLIESINKRAGEFTDKDCPMPERDENMSDTEWDEIVSIAGNCRLSTKLAYISGCKDQHELMIEFDKWKVDNGYMQYGYKWSKREIPESNDEVFTTEQLFEYWLNNVKGK